MISYNRPEKQNEVIRVFQLDSPKLGEVAKQMNLKDEIITIRTPFFRYVLDDPEINLTITYPQIVNITDIDKYPPPPYHFEIFPKSKQNPFAIYIPIKTQMKEEFPDMEIEFSKDDFSKWTAKYLLQKCVENFFPGSTNCKLIIGTDEKVNENLMLEEIFNNYFKPRMVEKKVNPKVFAFQADVPEDMIKKVKTRCHLAAEIISSETSFVHDIQQINDYWFPKIKESEIFDELQLRLIFRDIAPLLALHTELLNQLKKLKVDYNTEFGGLFLNFVDRFKISAPFISNYKNVDELIKKKISNSIFVSRKFKEIEENNPEQNGMISYHIM